MDADLDERLQPAANAHAGTLAREGKQRAGTRAGIAPELWRFRLLKVDELVALADERPELCDRLGRELLRRARVKLAKKATRAARRAAAGS